MPADLSLATPRPNRRDARYVALLAGVSLVALTLASPSAHARQFGSGSPTIAPPTIAADAATEAAQQAAKVAKQARDSMSRATQAIQAMQGAQAAARAAAQVAQKSAALPTTIPNGVGAGGLLPNVPKGWSGAGQPTQSVDSAGQTNVNIDQNASQAILNWTTFNVGARTTLTFDQHGNASWVALNRVDATTGPSQILGNIKADGTVLVINQSGIIFGGASQINVGSLIASSAGITDAQFKVSGIYSTQVSNSYVPSFTGAGDNATGGLGGKVIVEQGAQLTTNAPTSVTQGGGYVLLMGTEVDNAGSITTPKGQVELAAGHDFILRPGLGTDTNQYSTTRGNEIAPGTWTGAAGTAGNWTAGGGTVTNTGIAFAQQGDITMAGHTVIQDGVLLSTTSVNQRGTIHLLDAASDASGSVTLTGNSLALILPELDSSDTALNSQRDALIAASGPNGLATGQFNNLSTLADRQDQSRVEIVTGGTVNFQNGSLTQAQGGQVSVSAVKRIFTESGATIDVSGVQGVLLPMSANEVEVYIQGNELRDSPQNRDSGNLANKDVWIDVRDLILVPAGTGGYASDRYYTPGGLLEVSGYLSNTAHTIGEWAAVGGSITLSSAEVIAQQGATFNIAGGSVQYQAGYLQQTYVLGSDGGIYNINDAPADLTFKSVVTGFVVDHPHWGVTEVYQSPWGNKTARWEEGYTVGRDAGQLILSAPTSVFEGDILADVIDGERQDTARPSDVTDGYKLGQTQLALAGQVSVGQYTGLGLTGAYSSPVVVGDVAGVTAGMSANDALPSDRANTVYFDASLLNKAGLGGFSAVSSKSIAIDAPLTLANGGQLTLTAPDVTINAAITAHSGNVMLGNLMHVLLGQNQNVQWSALTYSNDNAQVTINATVDLTGSWSNGANNQSDTTGLAYLDGGDLTVSTTGGVTLARGGRIDVSSGGAILANGKSQGGAGGNVSLIADDYSRLDDTAFLNADITHPLIVDGTIRGYGFNGGGTLTLGAGQAVVIGGDAAGAAGPVLTLSTSLFQAGFSNYDIRSNAGMQVSDGTQIDLQVPVYQFTAASYSAPTGTATADAASLWTPPTFLNDAVAGQLTQRVGAKLTLTALGDFTLDPGTAINADPGRAVSIYANGQITIDGSIIAPGGAIAIDSVHDVAGSQRYGNGYGTFSPTRSIWIGETAKLDVAGRAYVAQDLRGRTYGVVQDGGSILIGGDGSMNGDANEQVLVGSDAFIIVRPGAIIDASGAPTTTLDVVNGQVVQPVQVAGSGGSITLYSDFGIYLDGTMRAAAGGSGASGGTLNYILTERPYAADVVAGLQLPHNLTLTQNYAGSGLSGDLKPGEADPNLKYSSVLGVNQIDGGGFDAVTLRIRDLFLFDGNVNLSVGRSLNMAGGIYAAGVGSDASTIQVHLSAPYVRLDGWSQNGTAPPGCCYWGMNGPGAPYYVADNAGLTISADQLDVYGAVYSGGVSNRGVSAASFGQVTLENSGDMRFGNGTVPFYGVLPGGSIMTSGDLTLRAAQLYPLSNAAVSIFVGRTANSATGTSYGYDPAATLTILGSGGAVPDVPASVFGSLTISAPNVEQGGVLRAPLGTIIFDSLLTSSSSRVVFRDGSVTSTSASGLTVPFGGTSDGITYAGVSSSNLVDLGSLEIVNGNGKVATGVSVKAGSFIGEKGALIDLSGGGNLTGAGFVSGRGGSVDVLTTPLINANPANSYSSASDKVYAIMPGYASNYAPAIATNGAGDPAIGQQITIPAGAPGLPAGTYTLLPSSYALLPGAYRVELGQTGTNVTSPVSLPNGSVIASGYLGIANTGLKDTLPTRLILTSGTAVRGYSQYNETSYADFAIAQAAVFNDVRPRLPKDGGVLELILGASTGSGKSLSFDGSARFGGVDGGLDGALIINSYNSTISVFDVTGANAAPVAGHITLSSADLNAFNASTLLIGGFSTFASDGAYGAGSRIQFIGYGTVNLLDGADLRAGQVFLIGNTVNVAGTATIDTRGFGSNGVDSTLGYVYGNTLPQNAGGNGPAVLAVANGWLDFLPVTGTSSINVRSGASLLTEGSIVLAAPGSLTMGDVDLGAKYLTVSQNVINAGTDASLAAAQAAGVLPSGWNLTQSMLDQLLKPSSAAGVPALEQLILTVGGSFNLYGSVSLDARGQSGSNVEFVLNTPAIYGLGGAGDSASITANTLVWNGVRTGNGSTSNPYANQAPAAIIANGPGTGSGVLNVAADNIVFGYDPSINRPTDGATLDRYVVGFSGVNITASDRITANSDGTLRVGLSKDVSGKLQGGNLTLTTPLLTAANGSTVAYDAGGAIRAVAASGVADTRTVADYGGTVAFNGESIFIDTAVALPSGKLTLNAVNDVVLGGSSVIDLSGRSIAFNDVTQYSWGGTVILQSANGNVSQAAGSVIDVSAANNVAGSINVSATDASHGIVSLAGTLKGAATGGYEDGQISVAAQTLGDFAAFNNRLNDAGFFGSRSFDLKQGDLVVGNGVKAHSVAISVDGGSLTVTGIVDASGATPGTITLAARDDLTLASTAVLDAHGTVLQTDSYGAPVEASNTAHVSLTTTEGTLTLSPGATIDMRVTDPANANAYGYLDLNVPRIGLASATSATGRDGPANATADSIAISAQAPLNILGVSSIALNAFATYRNAPADPSDTNGQIINQAWLDLVDQDSRAFIANIYGGNPTGGQLTGDLQSRIAGLLDPKYRPIVHIRPGVEIQSKTSDGNLSTSGDIDLSGYRYGPNADRDATSPTYGAGEPMTLVMRAGGNVTVKGSISDGFGQRAALAGIPPTYSIQSTPEGTVLATTLVFTTETTITTDWPVPTDDYYSNTVFWLTDINGNPYYPGDIVPAGTVLAADGYNAFEKGITLPGYSVSVLTDPGTPASPAIAATSPLAPMLAAGSLSASIRIVAGADLAAADTRIVQAANTLNGDGNITLSDPRYTSRSNATLFSVIRTGTGDLELLAGNNFTETTVFGVYTAGTAIAETGTSANDPYNLGRERTPDGTVLGLVNSAYEGSLSNQRMYYTEHGGDLFLSAQGNISGALTSSSTLIGDWLWRQGGSGIDQATAWGINFASYAIDYDASTVLRLAGFTGIGTLGGGNITLNAGGDIGDAGHGIVAAIGGSGRVRADGSLVQTGGGTLSVTAGGNIGTGGNQFVNLRGDIDVATGNFGSLVSTSFGYLMGDPRPQSALSAYQMTTLAGGSFAPGDGVINMRARGDLAMGNILDPGRVGLAQQTDIKGSTATGQGGVTWFTLWTDRTALNLFSAGGDVSPLSSTQAGAVTSSSTYFLPSILRATASNGDIYLTPSTDGSSLMLPSHDGGLELLAGGSIIQSFGSANAIGPLSTSMSALATPFNPGWAVLQYINYNWTFVDTNFWSDPNLPADGSAGLKAYSYAWNQNFGYQGTGGTAFVFGPDTVSDASALNPDITSRLYAMSGDILNVNYGQTYVHTDFIGGHYVDTNYYRAAKPVAVMADGDIVNMSGLILQNDPATISTIAAGDSLIYLNMDVAGPGTLEITTGKNIYQGSTASVESIGPLMTADNRPGASIVMQAGVGAGTPGVGQVDWADFAKLYLDPANLADASKSLADQPGKVAKTYISELVSWLQNRFGYTGSADDALTYFFALPGAQQRVFLRSVYYAELTAGGREFNDTSSSRYKSYLRGRDAIAALFPNQNAYQGDITMFSAATGTPGTANYKINSGFVHTDFGGDIQFLAPGGGVTIGTDGLLPGADAGLITQGEGNIQIYSQDSLLLGLSRIMTTFGGNILAWSAEGDINAGRGSKTTVVFTPPKRVYDSYGRITLSPQVPSTGAGIATLNPIPEVPPGDIDLIAPLGTIDAGEAGIRVSGNVNLAALQVVNAANIQVQGTASGLPTVQGPPVAALTSASNTAAATQQSVQPAGGNNTGAASVMIVEIIGYGGGDGDDGQPQEQQRSRQRQSSGTNYEPTAMVRILGDGAVTAEGMTQLTEEERRALAGQNDAPSSY